MLTAIGTVAVTTPPASTQEMTMRVLTVTGQGSERLQTTQTQVELGVEVAGNTVEAVQQDLAQRASSVIDLLRDRGVAKLQTTRIQLSPQYDYSGDRERLIGYVGRNTVSFQVPTEQVGALLDDAVAAGATQIQRIDFTASDEAIATARDAALQAATNDAQSQANVVLSALNLSAAEVVGIQINPTESVRLANRTFAVEQAAALDASTPVVGGEQTVEATVTLEIRY